jgi:sulfonate transport system ATP-binding protein
MTADAVTSVAFAPPRAAATPKLRAVAAGDGASVTLRGLSKSFGPKEVLRRIDLTVPAGQFLAIVGRSGCGKSTLLRTVVGLETPTVGSVQIGGGQAGRIMFQEPRLLPWARVIDSVRVGLPAGGSRAAARAAAQAALEQVGLGDRGGDWPSTLSGGQKQRVALARALVSQPRLLALDEPLGALDALTRIEMQHLIEQMWRDQRFSAILVTHDVSEALAMADRVVLIEDGRIELDLEVDLPRPRRRGSAELGQLEETILDKLFGAGGRPSDDRPGARSERAADERRAIA